MLPQSFCTIWASMLLPLCQGAFCIRNNFYSCSGWNLDFLMPQQSAFASQTTKWMWLKLESRLPHASAEFLHPLAFNALATLLLGYFATLPLGHFATLPLCHSTKVHFASKTTFRFAVVDTRVAPTTCLHHLACNALATLPLGYSMSSNVELKSAFASQTTYECGWN